MSTSMSDPPAPQPLRSDRLRVAHLNPQGSNPFRLAPDAARMAAIARELGLDALSGLVLEGTLRAESGDGWTLAGRLRACVTQPCGVTLVPVETRLDEPVERRYSPHLRQPEGDEVAMPDETLEPLGQFIDLGAVMVEDLALIVPPYPRSPNAAFQTETAQASIDTRRPFAGLDRMLRNPDPE